MKMKLENVQLVNLAGVLLAVFAFVFGPWLGNRSAAALLMELASFLSQPGRPADISRQQTIFGLLILLALLLTGQVVTAYLALRTSRRGWLIAELTLSALALFVMAGLFFGFEARTNGLIVTALGSFIAGNSALILALRPTEASETAAVPAPATDESTDPMVAFQQKMAAKFHASLDHNKPFCLGIIGIAHFDGYVTIFGEAEAQKLTQALLDATRHAYPSGEAITFSVGAMMFAWPDIAEAQTPDLLQQILAKMRTTGFTGEMLLPGGQVELVHGLATHPQHGSNLGQLTEHALSAFADETAKLDPASSPAGGAEK